MFTKAKGKTWLKVLGLALVALTITASQLGAKTENGSYRFSSKQLPNVKLVTDSVKFDLDVMATVSDRLNIEGARCITRYKAEPEKDYTKITLLELGPAEVALADSMGIKTYAVLRDGQQAMWMCKGKPAIHSHLPINGKGPYLPSELDWNTLVQSGAAFGIVMMINTKEKKYAFELFGYGR